jgi:hypothetical protein
VSHTLAEYMRLRQRAYKAAPEFKRTLSQEERKALHSLRQEARRAGARLDRPGRGGLQPSLVLAVLRRDQFACRGGCQEHAGGLTVHHVRPDGGNQMGNLHTLCQGAHDREHAE